MEPWMLSGIFVPLIGIIGYFIKRQQDEVDRIKERLHKLPNDFANRVELMGYIDKEVERIREDIQNNNVQIMSQLSDIKLEIRKISETILKIVGEK
jgi:predicted  nucleic acid-binding Zn-ribbon protein